MQASNNSPLPKGDLNNQELKTKGTIWKPLIAVSLLSVFSFTAGQYLPYVIAAVSGSGAIAAVPLAIFAVSTVVALVLATYLIKLAVSKLVVRKKQVLMERNPAILHLKNHKNLCVKIVLIWKVNQLEKNVISLLSKVVKHRRK